MEQCALVQWGSRLPVKERQMEETGTGPPLEQDRDSLLILSQQEQCWLIGSEVEHWKSEDLTIIVALQGCWMQTGKK